MLKKQIIALIASLSIDDLNNVPTEYDYPDCQMSEALTKIIKAYKQNNNKLPLESIEQIIMSYNFSEDRVKELIGRLSVFVSFVTELNK